MAITITLDAYDAGDLYFTILGGVVSGVIVESSTNDGATWSSAPGTYISPRTGFLASVPTLFRIRSSDDSGVLSNELSSEALDVTLTRTNINNANQISFCNSPIHLRLQNTAQDNTILSATVYLWIWNGAQNKILGDPNHTLVKSKVSVSDD